MFFKATVCSDVMRLKFLFFLMCLISLFFIPIGSEEQIPNTSSNDAVSDTLSEMNFTLMEQYVTEGNNQFDAGNYQDAMISYDKSLSIFPNNTDVLYQKGRCLNNLGNYDEAIIVYDKVLSIDANYSDALKSRGLSLDNLGKTDEAIASYDQALSISPNDTGVLFLKGSTLGEIGKYDEAMTYFNQTINIDPTDTDALYQMGQTLEKVGRKDDAVAYYDKVLAIDPTNTEALNSKNLALGQPVTNQVQGSKLDQGILLVIGIIIAFIVGIIIIDRVRHRRRQKTDDIDLVVTDVGEKIDDAGKQTQTKEDDDWKGI